MKHMAAGLFLLLFVAAASAQSPINIANIKIRVERPDRVRNPIAPGSSNRYDGKDNIFNEIEITPGTFYGYTANGSKTPPLHPHASPRADSRMAWDPPRQDGSGLRSIRATNYDSTAGYGSCGLWLKEPTCQGTTYYGFAHAEGYSSAFPSAAPMQLILLTTKSMALLTSSDGLNWSLSDQIISNPNGELQRDGIRRRRLHTGAIQRLCLPVLPADVGFQNVRGAGQQYQQFHAEQLGEI